MCGIIGVTGLGRPVDFLVEGLKVLEYRGYDSAGIAVVGAGELVRIRVAERTTSIAALAARAATLVQERGAGIGHTRWATHGAPTDANAHPHVDCSGRIAVVHNGIIENHRELADELVAAGHILSSQTDTEVICHLVEAELLTGCSLVAAVAAIVPKLRGDFAFVMVSADEPDSLVATRRSAPLIIGMTESLGLVASDLAALVGTTRRLYQLGDDQVALVRPGVVEAWDLSHQAVSLKAIEVTWDVAAAQKGGYPDFMSKEMNEQPQAVAETLLGRVRDDGTTEFEELVLSREELLSARKVLLLACGSSYHAALVGRTIFERWAKLPTEVEIASEFRYRGAILEPGTLVLAISQSGETADTLHAMLEAKRLGARCLALTNVLDSVMSREADGVLYTRAGPEIGVASTKCHLVQIALLEAFAIHLANERGIGDGDERSAIARSLLELPDLIESVVARSDEYRAVAAAFAAVEDFYYLGRRLGLPVAFEGALKLKELAYVRAEAYPAGEMKHGPISLIEPGAVVVVVATRSGLYEKVMLNVEEMRARGATIVAVCDAGDNETIGLVDAALEVPAVCEELSPMLNVVPLQYFAYEIATRRGRNVDRPRNLAKVVTVE